MRSFFILREGTLQIRVNGAARTFAEPLSVAQLLAACGINALRVAVEVNLRVVPRAAFGDTLLAEGDQVEIVQFMGGGSRNRR
jgi:thiamine biosynthesis protein ThiS